MSKRSSRQTRRTQPNAVKLRWSRKLLSLTLIPLAAGALLIIAWLFDFILWISPEFQITLASLLILLTFSASHAIQKNWLLAAGWLLVAAAAWLLLNRAGMPAQVAAFSLGGAGLVMLGLEIARRARQKQALQKTPRRR